MLVVVGVGSIASAEPTKAEALAVVDAWAAAQNAGDAAAYNALYAPKFVGIKRTSTGGSARFSRAQWQTDRKKMFKIKQEVAAENPTVSIKNDKATVQVTQRYRSGAYADHGDKLLVLVADKTGALQIVREELLYSAEGWDDGSGNDFDVKEMVSPITVTVREAAQDPKHVGDCGSVSYTLVLSDAKKKKEELDIGGGFVAIDTAVVTFTPDMSNDENQQFGGWCAGGGDYYKVIKNGDALVVRYKGVDEDSDPEHPAPPPAWETRLTVVLPAGARVK
jgi:ketosteroid isomerase-like protein